MKTLIKVVKREDRESARETDISLDRTTAKLTTEMIVKRWIIESREHRESSLRHLQASIGWKETEGLAHG